jgi:hypothetical protein
MCFSPMRGGLCEQKRAGDARLSAKLRSTGPRIAIPTSVALLLLVGVLCACSSDDSAPQDVVSTGGSAGAQPDGAGADASQDSDSGPTGQEGGKEADAPFVPPPTLQASEPQPLVVSRWLVASFDDPNTDAVAAMLETGAFVLPTPNSTYGGQVWEPVAPGPNGELLDSPNTFTYAATQISVPAGQRVIARGDYVSEFDVANSEVQPGDVYGSKKIRVPLDASGDALIVAAAQYPIGAPAVQLWTTTDELYFNALDATLPDLVVGADFEQWIGMPVLNLTDQAVVGLRAVIVDSGDVATTSVVHPSLPPHAVTQVAFQLRPKQAPTAAGDKVKVRLRLEPPGLEHSYEREIDVPVVAADAIHRRARRSAIDGSVQYYAVLPPSGFNPSNKYGLILSLHGAGVEASGQAGAYAPKSWAWLIAPTNRRPFGFDWEEWGRRDAMEALDHASEAYNVEPTRVHLTGHSMGGHGTWHAGVHFTHRFATINPSAGWSSFESYGGETPRTGPIGRARAASRTLDYVSNLADRAVYILHGGADTNVPVSEAQLMYNAVKPVTQDVTLTIVAGMDHWWDDGSAKPGVACVDWGPMMQQMESRTRDPIELDFPLRTPGPWVSSTRSYVTVRSCTSPMQDCVIESKHDGGTVTVSTTNVRSLVLDGAALTTRGITRAVVDGTEHTVSNGPIEIGPQDGKTPEVSGPLNQVFSRPFCFVYDPSSESYRRSASWLTSIWAVIGNGQACAVSMDQVTDAIRSETQLVYVGVASKSLPAVEAMGVKWDGALVQIGDKTYPGAAVWVVFPDQGKLSAAIGAPTGHEYMVRRFAPFSSRAGMPDFFVYDRVKGLRASGFFDASWKLDPGYAEYK